MRQAIKISFVSEKFFLQKNWAASKLFAIRPKPSFFMNRKCHEIDSLSPHGEGYEVGGGGGGGHFGRPTYYSSNYFQIIDRIDRKEGKSKFENGIGGNNLVNNLVWPIFWSAKKIIIFCLARSDRRD